jgi:probable phosphoglycerate mutase
MRKTKIWLVRHGETQWNVALRLQGMKDSKLTQNGLRQAEMVARTLQTQKFNLLISSDLGRAIRTADIINKYHGLPVRENKAMRERNFGIMEGLTREEIRLKFPDVFNGYMERKDSYDIPEGESLTAFYHRVIQGLNSIVEQHEGTDILIVSHGGVLDCIMRYIFNYPLSSPRRFSIYNGSISTFSVSDKGWFLEQWGNTDHQHVQSYSIDKHKG